MVGREFGILHEDPNPIVELCKVTAFMLVMILVTAEIVVFVLFLIRRLVD